MASLKKLVGQERAKELMEKKFNSPKRLALYGGMELVIVAIDDIDDVPQVYAAEKNEDNMAAIKARQSIKRVLWKGTGQDFLKLLPASGKVAKVQKTIKKAAKAKKVVKLHKRPAVKVAAVKRKKGPQSAK